MLEFLKQNIFKFSLRSACSLEKKEDLNRIVHMAFIYLFFMNLRIESEGI